MAEKEHWLLERIRAFDGLPAVVTKNRVVSYSELASLVDEMHGFLDQHQNEAGMVTATLTDYGPRAIALFLALMARRSIVVPLTSTIADEVHAAMDQGRVEQAFQLRDERVESVDVKSSAPPHPLISELRGLGHPGLVLFSSGSTGAPKAMIHDLDRLVEGYRQRKMRPISMLVFLMFDHIGGLNTLFSGLAMGAKLVFPPSRDPDEVAALIQEQHVRLLPTSPTFLNLLLVSGAVKRFDLSSLRIATYGTEPMPESLLNRLRLALPKVRFMQSFGTSETGIVQTITKSGDSTLFRLQDPDMEYRIVEGELWLKSAKRILGYLNRDQEGFTGDGWFRTGDLVEETEDGFLRIAGRLKEIINVGGRKVLPGEVEEALLALDQVADCLVYGFPNAITGQAVAADIRPTDTQTKSISFKKEVRQALRERLDGYKVPQKIRILDQMAISRRYKKIRIARPNEPEGP